MIDRRTFTLAAGAAVLPIHTAVARRIIRDAWLDWYVRSTGGRLGAYILDTGDGWTFERRADERFCHCSTFKLSLAAMTLREADAGRLDLREQLAFSRADLVAYAPVVEANLAKGRLPIATLAEAVQVTSDNTAANILLRRLGGPAALTRFWRAIGDNVSRLDGYEPAINVIPPGTQENSTTPRAMAETVRRIVLGDVLSGASRERLRGWMAATQTGLHRIRAGVPANWRALDKTGTGMRLGVGNKTNDLAVLFPPGERAPVIVIAYYETPSFWPTFDRRMSTCWQRWAGLRPRHAANAIPSENVSVADYRR